MEVITVKDFSSICRFCLHRAREMNLISSVPSAAIFQAISGIEVADVLPEKMCLACMESFQSFSSFIEKSKANIQKLQNIYETFFHEVKADDSSFYNLEDEEFSNSFENNHAIQEDGSCKPLAGVKCEHCNKEYSQSTKCHCLKPEESQTKNSPKKRNLLSKRVRCRNCKVSFKTREELSAHCKNGFTCSLKDYQCPTCNRCFKKQHKLNNHMRSHTKIAPFKCPDCDKAFKFQQNLKRHILIHKGIKKFKCEDCGKSFSRAHVLNDHKNIHTGHNPYICDYCGKGFKRYANHFIHVYRHKLLNGEVNQADEKKLYLQLQCSVCNKIFASRGSLENHLTLHQEEPREKKFLCTDCGKGFASNSQLQCHMRIHTGDRPFECTECDKRFKQRSAFSIHKLVHSGTKPYQCSLCQQVFSQSGHLKIHMRVHSGEKPFTCDFCGRKFALNGNLKVHTRTHTGERPFVCSVCQKAYYNSSSLKKHMKTHEQHLSGD
uniref:Protein krueppel n=2 Tax=Dendroctonus ponderosae TaxID=77166 RepID=A0AAR5NX43_DENPD